ncbi:MAG TPA: hypothetical protein VGD89_10225 [Flavipsychrobacter sp.]
MKKQFLIAAIAGAGMISLNSCSQQITSGANTSANQPEVARGTGATEASTPTVTRQLTTTKPTVTPGDIEIKNQGNSNTTLQQQ